jgi:hypothetical protein
MNHIAFSNIRIPLMYDFEGTRELLEAKMKKINLHDIYSRAAYAKNENDRRIEINNYLKLKSRKSKSQY